MKGGYRALCFLLSHLDKMGNGFLRASAQILASLRLPDTHQTYDNLHHHSSQFSRSSGILGSLIIFALIIISQHWINLIVGAILIVLLCLAMIEEEERNIEFGNAYRDYMKRVPRINLIAGIIRQIHKKRGNNE